MNHSQQVPSRDQLLAKTGVLLIVDQITPPSGPVAKGVTPVVKARELALFIAVSDDGMVYAFNGHVDLHRHSHLTGTDRCRRTGPAHGPGSHGAG